MGRKCWAPAQPEHDLINNKATLPRKDAKAAPEHGYVDFARGGALHKEPDALGHHPLTKKNAALTQSAGRGAGLKSGMRPRGGGSWVAQPGWSLKEDNKPWELQGTKQPSEMTVRFKPVPKDFVPRVALAKRHATDQKCDLKGKYHVDYMSEQVMKYTGKTQPRVAPIPAKPVQVHLGAQSLTYHTANLDHFDDKVASFRTAAERPGGGLPLTQVPPYNVITGGGELTHYPKDHYGSARARAIPRAPGDMPLLYHPPPQTNRPGFDIISGRDKPAGGAGEGWAPYEHYGAKRARGRAGATAAGAGAGARTSRHERSAGAGAGGRPGTDPMSTRPW